MITVLFKTVLYFVTAFGIIRSQDPCSSYEQLKDNTRSPDYTLAVESEEQCDRWLKDAWYRLENPSTTNMPTTCIPTMRCGSSSPIWINGTLPIALNEIKQLTACKSNFMDCCDSQFTIDVKNCGSFNVYHLTPLSGCYGRYCVLPGYSKCKPGTSSESGFEPCARSLQFDVLPEIKPDIFDHTDRHKLFLIFRCNVPGFFDSRHFFDIKYFIDGQEVTCTTCKKTNISYDSLGTVGALKKAEWTSNSNIKKIDFMIKCLIRAKLGTSVSEWKTSAEFFAGIKILTPHVSVVAGTPATIRVVSTVPVACVEYPRGVKKPCKLYFEMFDFIREKSYHSDQESFCSGSSNVSSHCGFELDGWKWYEPASMNINTLRDIRQTSDYEAVVHIRAVNNDDDLWNYYKPDEIRITVMRAYISTGQCRSNEDPNIHTSDGSFFLHHDTGEFILYQHKTKPIEVHVIHKRRGDVYGWNGGSYYTANCAVAIRAASDVFVVYGCDDPPKWVIKRLNCDQSRGAYLNIYQRNNGEEYEVHLPTGTRIVIQIFKIYYYLDITLFDLTSEYGQSHGLCGHFNGISNDDYKDKSGLTIDEEQFKRIWRVDPSESLFRAESRNEKLLKPYVLLCSCTNESIPIPKLDHTADCSWKESRNLCPQKTWTPHECSIRSKRSTTDDEEDIVDFDVPIEILEHRLAPQNIDQWKNGWNETSATEFCTEILHRSAAYQKCNGRVNGLNGHVSINICLNDIKISGTTRFSLQSTQAYTVACLNEIRTNSTLWTKTSNMQTQSLAEEILSSDCPNDCSTGNEKRGNCVQGVCICFRGYTSDDCSIKEDEPPILVASYTDSKCDLSKSKCNVIPVFGQNLHNTNSLRCRVDEIEVNHGFEEKGHTHIVSGRLESFNEVRCSISTIQRRRRRSISPTKSMDFNISVTTNGFIFSQPISIVLYDSSCTDCNVVKGRVTCQQKKNTCVINNICYPATTSPCKTEDNKNKNMYWIIGVVLGGMSLLLILAFVLIKMNTRKRTQTGISMPDLSENVTFTLPPKSTEYRRW